LPPLHDALPISGCTGTIDEGYCDLCGTAASPQPAPSGAGVWTQPSSATRPVRGTGPSSRGVTGPASSGRSRAGVLAEIADLPSAPSRDPARAGQSDPQVPEEQPVRANLDCRQPVVPAGAGTPA